MKFVKYLFIAMFTFPCVVVADGYYPDRAYLSIYTAHIGEEDQSHIDPNYEAPTDFTPGVLVAWENRALGLDYMGGFLLDSHSDPSFQLGVGKLFSVSEHAKIGGVFSYRGELSGDGADGDFFPTLAFSYKNAFANGLVLPADGKVEGIITFGLTFSLQ